MPAPLTTVYWCLTSASPVRWKVPTSSTARSWNISNPAMKYGSSKFWTNTTTTCPARDTKKRSALSSPSILQTPLDTFIFKKELPGSKADPGSSFAHPKSKRRSIKNLRIDNVAGALTLQNAGDSGQSLCAHTEAGLHREACNVGGQRHVVQSQQIGIDHRLIGKHI